MVAALRPKRARPTEAAMGEWPRTRARIMATGLAAGRRDPTRRLPSRKDVDAGLQASRDVYRAVGLSSPSSSHVVASFFAAFGSGANASQLGPRSVTYLNL